uniref:F-box domain-containing protein n=1 Tax=Panagrolaimus sp. ES5 TaxID=591445 RepID=A0AC34G521_9BILA
MLTFNTENMEPQNFPFKPPIMDYIFKNVEPKHLIQLYQTCKSFYNKFRRNIILNLEIADYDEAEVLDPTKTIICGSNPNLQKLADFWITDSFNYRTLRDKFIPLFCYYTIKKLELHEYILWKEFEILTKAGTIEEIKIKGVFRDQSFVGIEDVISQVPNAKSIEICESIFTATTCASLASLNHKAKLSNIILHNINESDHFYVELLKEFIFKNTDIDCKVHVDFEILDGDSDNILDLNNALQLLADVFNDALVNSLEIKNLTLAS